MTVTQKQLDDFYRFASDRVRSGGEPVSLDDLLVEWDSRRDREDINAAIREELADVEAGRHRPAAEVMEELGKKHGLATE